MNMTRRIISSKIINKEHNYSSDSFIYKLISNQIFLTIVGLTFLLIIIFPFAKVYTQKKATEKEIEGIRLEIKNFEKKNKDLKQMIEYLQSDQATEEQARLNFNMKKPGEQVVVINRVKNLDKISVDNSQEAKKSNFKKWWDYFFN